MKSTQVTELFANIKKTFVSFFSIFMFVALGVGIFLGISWAGPALHDAAEKEFDEGAFHDFQVQFPYGLTDDDLKELAGVEGVSDVEAARQAFQTIGMQDDANATVKLQSLPDRIDVLAVLEGELPEKSDEIALNEVAAENLGYGVGDTITFEPDAVADDDAGAGSGEDGQAPDEDGMKYLTNATFKVTGLVKSPEYLAKDSATYGFSTAPSGGVDLLAWAPDSAFDPSAFKDGYPVVNVACDSLADMGTFSGEYKKRSAEIEQRVGDLGEGLAQARYDDLHDQAQRKIDEAEQQLADAREQIESGTKQLEEGRAELESQRAAGEAKLAAAYQQLMEGEREKAEGEAALALGREALSRVKAMIKGKRDTDVVEYEGVKMTVGEVRALLPQVEAELKRKEAEYQEKVAELNAGWSHHSDVRAELDARVAEGERQLAEGEQKIEDAKKQVAENEPKLEEAKSQLAAMKKYDWTVTSRAYNAGVAEVSTFSNVTNNLSFSMAALFIIVGLLVSYSAVSRIVHEQITQIGTKKALGLRSKEITASFLAYSAIAVVAGAVVGTVVGIVLVEGIIGHVLAGMFVFGDYPPHFGLPLFLVVTALELVLVLGATWIACRGILKQHAVELLRGEKPPEGKTRFYEEWGVWEKLPLLTQTIVNNCVNDKRRVFSTVVGVAGCTALIVTALTLNNDVLKSYDAHYADVYGFDAIAYVDPSVDGAVDEVAGSLERQGATAAPVLLKRFVFDTPNGEHATVRLIVPEDAGGFAEAYHVNAVTGAEFDPAGQGVWMSQAYAEHFGAKVGDKVTLTDSDGVVHEMPILGLHEFWLTYHEMVMGRDYYESEFDATLEPNVVLADTHDADVDEIALALRDVEGFDSITDDKTYQHGNFETFSKVSSAVVLIYMALSILMAIVVLLNLNVMFIEEKKRELIVLMINGFSVKDAKKYIYNDTIVLTVIGIVLGVVLGCVMGAVTVGAIEPSTATFIKAVDWIAVLVGVAGSAVLALVMSVVALRRIPRFELTDINKF